MICLLLWDVRGATCLNSQVTASLQLFRGLSNPPQLWIPSTHLQTPVLIPKMGGEGPVTQIIMAKLIKAIHVHRLAPPEGGVREVSIGCKENKGCIAQE